MGRERGLQGIARNGAMIASGLILLEMLTGCIAVGYSNRGGWFVWPRGLGVVLAILFVVLLLRRRR